MSSIDSPQFGQVWLLPAGSVRTASVSAAPIRAASAGAASTGAQGPARLRITRRGRFVLTSLIALPVAFAAMFGVINAGGAIATAEGSSVPLEQFTVEPGQTLWQVAGEYAPDSDPREFIAEVEALNGISGTIEPGQVLDIPAMYSAN